MLSSRMGSRKWRAAGCVGALVALGLIVLAVQNVEDQLESESTEARESAAEEIVAAAAARIDRESTGEVAPRDVRGRTSVEESPHAAASVGDPPAPPPGYTFVDHSGEMAKARMEHGSADSHPAGGDRPEWMDSDDAVSNLVALAAEAGRDWSFGWIRLAADATHADFARAIEGTGAEIVGASGRMVRARLPGDSGRLRAIASLDAVDAIGAPPPETKLAAFDDGPIADAQGRIPVYVSLMADDADGRWRRALADLGAVAGRYDPSLRMYRANATHEVIEALARADFVLRVEPIPIVRAAHDTAVPAMGADALRTWDGSPGLFVGADGTSVPVAVMDTGLNIHHPDIAMHRDSICGANFAYNSGWDGPDGPVVEDEDLWIDRGGHGTHVTGTVAGNGFVQRRFAGMAPGVRHIRFAKVLDTRGWGVGDSIVRGMDFLAGESACVEVGEISERIKPLIVNMSLSAVSRRFDGRDVDARKLDSTVWSHRQLYVVAQSNAGIHGFSEYGAAKNSLAVGAAMDGGAHAPFSSHGPTADGRLAPNVVGTGVRVHSAKGEGSRGGYVALGGTSMASPAVAGVAALLMDAAPAHKEHPALTRARLMASAIRPDPWLADGAGFPPDNTGGPGTIQARFGMGKVSARTAVLNRDGPDGWTSGSATVELEDGEYAFEDIEVPAGTSRLDLVMTWDEPAADAVASTVLNDLDLWLDRDGDCGAAACGERSSRSRVDNVEWIILRDPEPGTYRAKILASRVYTEEPRAALAWTVIRGKATPTLSIKADKERIEADGEHELTLTVQTDGYVAAGTRLHVDCRAGGETTCNDLVTIEGATASREDGVSVDLEDEANRPVPDGSHTLARPIPIGASMPLGEIAVEDRRDIEIRVSVAEDAGGDATLHFTASAWNARAGSVAVAIGSDEVPAIRRPTNDHFASARTIEGEQGSVGLDLLHATPEPGEPVADDWEGRPASSLWYEWTAPRDGPFRFEVATPSSLSESDDGVVVRLDRVHVFRGEAVAGLREVASGLWRVTLFAERGEAYFVRVAGSSRGTPVDLRWFPGERPGNDNFADAVDLNALARKSDSDGVEQEFGSIEGNNADATLEPGESFGSMAATTWYRWTAPRDGVWRFRAEGREVLVFEGEVLSELRLVGPYPGYTGSPWVPVGEGREYRIAVASRSPEDGGPYELDWNTSGLRFDNDGFWRPNHSGTRRARWSTSTPVPQWSRANPG